jgi:hypothetical protein
LFAIQEIKTNTLRVYEGKTEKIQEVNIGGAKISSINRVYEPSKKRVVEFWQRVKPKTKDILYIKIHSYREESDSGEISLSETESELDEET